MPITTDAEEVDCCVFPLLVPEKSSSTKSSSTLRSSLWCFIMCYCDGWFDCCMLHLQIFCVIKPSWRIKWLSTWDMTLRINNNLPVQWSNGGASQADHHQQHKHHQCVRVLKCNASAHTLWWNQNKAVNYGRADTGDVSDYWGWGWRRWSQRCIVGIGQCWGRGGRRTGRHGARPFLWVL